MELDYVSVRVDNYQMGSGATGYQIGYSNIICRSSFEFSTCKCMFCYMYSIT